MKNLTITEVLKAWREGRLDIMSLWYDCFCDESELEERGEELMQKLDEISASTKFDNDKTYVFFKNNCPALGTLYDDFRICDMENDDVIYTVTPLSGRDDEKGKANVWGQETGFHGAVVEGSWDDVRDWFLK
jgi:hypothetical protein